MNDPECSTQSVAWGRNTTIGEQVVGEGDEYSRV